MKLTKAQAEKLVKALEPFANAVDNDNHEMGVRYGAVDYADYVRAYFAHRALLSALKEDKRKLTKAQRANLEHIKLFGEAKSRAGFWCRRHGLSEFVWLTVDGERIGNADWAAKYGDATPIPQEKLLVKVVGERLTPSGLKALTDTRNP